MEIKKMPKRLFEHTDKYGDKFGVVDRPGGGVYFTTNGIRIIFNPEQEEKLFQVLLSRHNERNPTAGEKLTEMEKR